MLLELDNTELKISGASRQTIRLLDRKTSYLVQGHKHVQSFKKGRWDGREHLLTYSSKSGYKVPCGLVHDVTRALDAAGIAYKLVDKTKVRGKRKKMLWGPVKLRDYQIEAVAEARRPRNRGRCIIKSPIRSGKTKMAVRLAFEYGLPTLFVVPSKYLLSQAIEAFRECLPAERIGQIGDGQNVIERITVATIQTLQRMAKTKRAAFRELTKSFDVLICDECFPAGTMVDGVPIERREVGDLILSFDENMQPSKNRIKSISKKKAESLVRLRFSNGISLVCTPNHPIRTQRGWISALLLIEGSDMVATINHAGNLQKLRETDGIRELAVARNVLEQMPIRRSFEESSLEVQGHAEAILREDVDEESHGESDRKSKTISHAKGHGTRAAMVERRQRKATSETSSDVGGDVGLETRICSFDKEEALGRLPSLLQAGFGGTSFEDWDRSGRLEPRDAEGASARQEEGSVFGWTRLESSEILEPGSDGEFGGLCPGGFVYNFEVENDHTYVADGIGVHNCHHFSGNGTWHNVLKKIDAAYRFGFTATLFPKRKQEQEMGVIWVRALLGRVAVNIPRSRLESAGHLMKQNVWIHRVLGPSGMEDDRWSHTLVQSCIFANRKRNRKIAQYASALAAKKHSVLVISRRVEQLMQVAEELDKLDAEYYVVTGREGTDERHSIMSAFERGKRHIVLGSVLSEGADIPHLEVVINGEGGARPVSAVQRQRNLTVHDGKKLSLFIDFYDDMNPYFRRHSDSRLSQYEADGASIKFI